MSFSGNFLDKSKLEHNNGYCKVDAQQDTNINGKFCFNEEQASAPTAPADGNGWLYTKSDGKIYWQSFDVAETDLTSSGGASDKIFNSNGKCEIQTNGDTFIDKNLGIGNITPSTELHVDGYQTFYKSSELPGYNNNGVKTPCKITLGNNNGPQILVKYPNNSYTDSTELHFKTANQNTSTDNSPSRIVIAGKTGYTTIGYGTAGRTYRLSVNGGTYSSGGFTSSDDRIKYNEQVINSSSALNLINQLSPQKYEKIIEQPAEAVGNWIPTDAEWPTVKDQYSWMDEAGLIAQDVQQIPELSWCVSGEEVDSEGNQTALRLNYNDIYAYHISATKELSSQLNEEKAKTLLLEDTIEELLLRVSALESL